MVDPIGDSTIGVNLACRLWISRHRRRGFAAYTPKCDLHCNRAGLAPDMLFFLYLLGIPARNRCPWTVIASGTDTRAEHHTIFLKCAQIDSLRERSGAVTNRAYRAWGVWWAAFFLNLHLWCGLEPHRASLRNYRIKKLIFIYSKL